MWPTTMLKNGLKIYKDSHIFITDFKNGIMPLNSDTGEVMPFLATEGPGFFKGVKDLVFTSNGDPFFTDQGLTGQHDPTGRLFRYTVDGQLHCLLETVPSPNDLVLNLEENLVCLNVTRTNAVWRVSLLSDGGNMKVGTFIQPSGGHGGPDGLAMDTQGNLVMVYVGIGAVWVFLGLGKPLDRIRSCEGLSTTNLAFGGPDNQTLYITDSDSGCILQCELSIADWTMYSHM